MTFAANTPQPSAPLIYAVYRGFYILPDDTLSPNVIRVDFFVARSADGIAYFGETLLSYGDANVGMYAVHAGLDENTQYEYRCQYVYKDGSKSEIGQPGDAGPAQLIASPNLNIDQLASREYSTGLITSGIFRGVEFQTAAPVPGAPMVQMDPTGLWATTSYGPNPTYSFYLNAFTGQALFNGVVSGSINIGSGAFTVDGSGNVGITRGSIDINSGAFHVDSSGNLTASSATISGAVTINSGAIDIGTGVFHVTSGGVLTASSANITGTITSNNVTITGGTLSIGANFSVSSGGVLTAAGGTFTSSGITGGYFQTSAGNPKIIVGAGSFGLQVFDSGGGVVYQIDTTNGVQHLIGASAINTISWWTGINGGAEESYISCVNTGIGAPVYTTKVGNNNLNFELCMDNHYGVYIQNNGTAGILQLLGNGGVNSDFVYAGGLVNFQVWGQYTISVGALAANASTRINQTGISANLGSAGSGFQVVGQLRGTGFADSCSWSVFSNTGSSIDFSFQNCTANAVSGLHFDFSIITFNGTSAL